MSKRAGVRRLGLLCVAAIAVATALFVGGTARAAITIAVHTSAGLDCAVDGFPSAATCSGAGLPISGAGDTINLDANLTYAPAHALDVSHNLTIQTDPAQLASGGRAGTITGGSITGSSALDPGSQLDTLVVGPANTLTIHNVGFTGAIQPSNGAIVVMGPPPAGGSGGTLSMDHSLISSNGSSGLDVMAGGQATVTNSTITQSNGFDGVLLDGAGTFNQDTIANNGANGINNHGGGIANVFNTILSGNTSGNCFFAITVANGSGSNSDDSGTSCGSLITTGGNSGTGTGVIAATVTNNGGPTNTYALPAGSVAIGHGLGAGGAATDQRGFLRDAAPDVGAYEFGATAPATLTVIKHVVGPGSPGNFQLTVTGGSPSPGTFVGQDTPGTVVTLASGTPYSISETMVGGGAVTGYTATASGNCTGGNPASGTSGAGGTNVTCTITNTALPTQLTVIKHVDNTGCSASCAAASAFTMTIHDVTTNTDIASFPGAEAPGHAPVAVPAGDVYTVTETGPTGSYTQSNGAGCSGTATAGGSISCTVTNTFIQCPQPPNSGPQPAPGPPGSSSNTCVNANVAATIQVTSPAAVNFPALAVGQTSGLQAVPVTVFSNDPTGYQLTVKRTAFFSPTDIPLAISCPGVAAPQAFLAPFSGASAQIPVGSSLNLGTSNTFTTVSGDSWPFQFQLGPIPFGVPAGAHQSVVTFTAVGL